MDREHVRTGVGRPLRVSLRICGDLGAEPVHLRGQGSMCG